MIRSWVPFEKIQVNLGHRNLMMFGKISKYMADL